MLNTDTFNCVAYVKWDDGQTDPGWGYPYNFEPLDDNDIPVGNAAPSPVIHHATVDISDWRSWRHNRPGECDCGIARVDCTFHKG